jgi:hypothetical protein
LQEKSFLQPFGGWLGPVGEDDVGTVFVLGWFVYKYFQLGQGADRRRRDLLYPADEARLLRPVLGPLLL